MLIVCVRHAEAGPAKENMNRRLTAKGIEQALALGEWLKNVPIDIALLSPARRTQETAAIALLDRLIDPASVRLITVSELCPLPPICREAEEINRVYGRLGHRPLVDYFKSEAKEVIEVFAAKAAGAVRKKAQKASAKNIIVVSHDVALSAIGLNLAPNPKNAMPLLSELIGEAEGFIFNEEEDGLITFIRQPKN